MAAFSRKKAHMQKRSDQHWYAAHLARYREPRETRGVLLLLCALSLCVGMLLLV